MVETVERIGDALGVVWGFFEDETGDLTLLANLLLMGLALATAIRCFRAMQPALEQKHSSVVAIGSAMTAVFTGVGAFFLYSALRGIGG